MPTHSVIETVSQVLAAADTLSIQFDPPADEARDGRFVPLAASSLHSELREVVGQVAPQGMFTHQHSAIESVLAGRHTIAATRTSSGKLLIFALPALDAMCRDESATSLFLYTRDEAMTAVLDHLGFRELTIARTTLKSNLNSDIR